MQPNWILVESFQCIQTDVDVIIKMFSLIESEAIRGPFPHIVLPFHNGEGCHQIARDQLRLFKIRPDQSGPLIRRRRKYSGSTLLLVVSKRAICLDVIYELRQCRRDNTLSSITSDSSCISIGMYVDVLVERIMNFVYKIFIKLQYSHSSFLVTSEKEGENKYKKNPQSL